MSKKYDCIVFIGRFQPIHDGHVDVINKAKELSDKVVIVIGSDDRFLTTQNPFYGLYREAMIRSSVNGVSVYRNYDTPEDNDAWVSRIEQIVYKEVSPNSKIAIIGYEKDHSSFYLKLFPNWAFESVEVHGEIIHATDIRRNYFLEGIIENVPGGCASFLRFMKSSEEYSYMRTVYIVENFISEAIEFITEFGKFPEFVFYFNTLLGMIVFNKMVDL